MGCSQGAGKEALGRHWTVVLGRHSSDNAAGAVSSVDTSRSSLSRDETRNYQAKVQFLAGMPLMKHLPKDQHPIVASMCLSQDFPAGTTVIEQGDSGDTFYVIRKGEAHVFVTGEDSIREKVMVLRAGDYFGEKALLRAEPRTATVIASTALQTFKITRAQFQELGLHEKLQFINRKAVVGGKNTDSKSKEPTPKTTEEYKLVTRALMANNDLNIMIDLVDSRVKDLIDAMWKEKVLEGQEIIREGNLEADYFYVVQEGVFEVFKSKAAGTSLERRTTNGEVRTCTRLGTITRGGTFGELALLYFVPRTATVVCREQGVLWVIDRKHFKSILMKVSDTDKERYMRYLEKVPILEALMQNEREELAKALVEMHFNKGDKIVKQGDPGNTFYILYQGSVEIIRDGEVQRTLEAREKLGVVHVFGEGALLDNELRGASVKVTSKLAKTLLLDRDTFNSILGPLKDIINGHRRNGYCQDGPSATSVLGPKHVHGKIPLKDLKRLAFLSIWGNSSVELCEHKTSGETYALKGFSKGYIVKAGLQESIMNEKNTLMMTNSVFIAKLIETYNSKSTLYFLLELCIGGDLYTAYFRKGLHGSERHCRYYSAAAVHALEHLHERRVLYRNLKPESLMLAQTGHVKLSDMSLAKFVMGKTYTTCGTPEYFAPEVVTSTGQTHAVDWWSLGILLFELMSGDPPFQGDAPLQIYRKVSRGIGDVKFPPKCKGRVESLIRELLRSAPTERLPVRPGGVDNLKNHEWYSSLDWNAMKTMTLDPPFQPIVRNKTDMSNFNLADKETLIEVEYIDPMTGWDQDFATQ